LLLSSNSKLVALRIDVRVAVDDDDVSLIVELRSRLVAIDWKSIERECPLISIGFRCLDNGNEVTECGILIGIVERAG
jgi:hypothetical protein